jgi:CheY-like chemotaxis protein
MLKLGSYSKKCRVVMLLEYGEKLHSRTSSIVDYTIVKPILPSKVSIHLTQIFRLPLPAQKQKKYKKKVVSALVVEDNLINQRLIKILLQEYNLKVTTASDGEQAVRLCRNYRFDIVFMDIDMPVKDGIAATREIKQLGGSAEMPIVALTAMAMQGDRERIMREGLDDYLSKPLTREKLEFVLEKYLKVKV